MLRDDVTQVLTNAGVPNSVIVQLCDAAMRFASAESQRYGFKVINTNSGMPAEFRIERV